MLKALLKIVLPWNVRLEIQTTPIQINNNTLNVRSYAIRFADDEEENEAGFDLMVEIIYISAKDWCVASPGQKAVCYEKKVEDPAGTKRKSNEMWGVWVTARKTTEKLFKMKMQNFLAGREKKKRKKKKEPEAK